MFLVAESLSTAIHGSVIELNLTKTGISYLSFKSILTSLNRNKSLKTLILDENDLFMVNLSPLTSNEIS